MELRYGAEHALDIAIDALILPIARSADGPIWPAVMSVLTPSLFAELIKLAKDAHFGGKIATTLTVPTLGLLPAKRLILTGIGETENLKPNALVRAAGAAVRAAWDAGATDVACALPSADWGIVPSEALKLFAIGATLAGYRFDDYRGFAAPEVTTRRNVDTVQFVSTELSNEQAKTALRRGNAIARGVGIARDLANEPASTLTPEAFAQRAQTIAAENGLEIEILDLDALAGIGAAATLAVGSGSVNGPRLIRLSYQPEGKQADGRVVGLVGKAITFDTGGYSIKPYEGMLTMKVDMAGGAAVLGAMSALRELDCAVAVEATICAAENMISGTAFRPGDVLKGMNGVTMEVLSTDAEGRLVLADGLVDTARRGATELIDLATLTGAAVVALGDGTTALFANDDGLADRLLVSAAETGERMWRLPLIDELEPRIEGEVADIKNTGGRAGGAITAALFLRHFSEGLPWAHLDIAGSARQEEATSLGPKGATGVGVRTLLHHLTGV